MQSMIYLIFDTNIWLYLANGFDSESEDFPKGIFSNHHFELLETLKENVLNNNFKILVNDIILKEWHRNQKTSESLLQLVWKRKSEIQKSKKTLNAFIPKEDRKKFEELIKKATNNVETLITRNRDHIKEVEDFLKNECIVIPISDEVKVKVTDLRLEKTKAPFKTKKDNFLDALILFSSADYLKDKLSVEFSRAIFVSNNYHDFATKLNDKEFHPDILQILGDTDLTYNRHLKNVVSLSEDLIAEMDYFLDYKRENYDFYCQSCEENQYYSPGGNFDSQIRVSDNRVEFDDPNQLKLFDFDEINVKNFPHLKFVNKGKCFFCGETHICCPECANLMVLNEEINSLYCEECDSLFEIKQSLRNTDKVIIRKENWF